MHSTIGRAVLVWLYPTVAPVQAAMRRGGIPLQELSSFWSEVTEADDDITQRTCRRRVQVDVR